MKLAANTTAPATRTLPADAHPGAAYETNYNLLMANQCREQYAKTYALIQALSQAHIEGMLEVTIRTSSDSLTIPFIGEGATKRAHSLYLGLAEMLGDKMTRLERDIVDYEQTSEKEEAADREGTSQRAELFAFCLPMRRMSDAEFEAMPAEARRAYDEHRADSVSQPVKGGQAA